MKPRYIATGILALVLFITLINSILSNIIASLIEQQLGVNAKLLIIPFLIAAAFLFGYEMRGQLSARLLQREPTKDKLTLDRNRERMLDRVESIWIKGVLETSLHNITRMELDLDFGPEFVDYPWEAIVQRSNMPDETITTSGKLLDIYNMLGGEMLILGAPGAGKTTILLDLTKKLIMKARKVKNLPIPVVFNLSSWSHRRRPLQEWLIDELVQKYDVPLRVATDWINNNHIQPMLDGLDEVNKEFRESCVETINDFRRDTEFVPLVICSRIADYELLGKKFHLNGAVVIKPLTPYHIDSYLHHKSLMAMKTFIKANPQLQQLLDTPLMLNVIALTFKNKQQILIDPSLSSENMRHEIFKAYIDAMFIRRARKSKYSREETISYLAWLACTMLRQSQTIFLLERIQPDWLETRAQRRLYFFIDRITVPILLGLTLGMLALGAAMIVQYKDLMVRVYSGAFTYFSLFTFGLTRPYALFIGIISVTLGIFFGGLNVSAVKLSSRSASLFMGIIVGGTAGYLTALYSFSEYESIDVVWGVYAVIGALIGLLVSSIVGGPSLDLRHIQIVEKVRWSFSKSFPLILLCLILAPLGWLLAFVVVSGFNQVSAFVFLRDGALAGLVIAIIVGLLAGLITDEIETKTIPNQGIRRSITTSFEIGFGILISGGVLGAAIASLLQATSVINPMVIQIGNRQASPIIAGLLVGFSEIIPFVIAAILSYGGFAVLSHYALMVVFVRSGFAPYDYIDFLDYCVDRIFLRRVGGGYSFIHRVLQETFNRIETGE